MTATLPRHARLSVAVTVKGNEPTTVGVPERTPVAGSSATPDGSAPAVTVHVALPVAPAAPKATGPKATPAVAFASEAGETTIVLQTRRVKAACTAQPEGSRNRIVTP